jgi:CRISPR system Cascade subunit CasA
LTTSSFDLRYEPWITCRGCDGAISEIGLRDALCRAHQLEGLTASSPLVTVSLLRLLLALAHRVVEGPTSEETWLEIMTAGRFNETAVDRYLDAWPDRFDLFHPQYPFMQVHVVVDGAGTTSVAKLAIEMASEGNSPLLFNHNYDMAMTPAQAARYLVAAQVFALGGLMTPWPKDSRDTKHGNIDAPTARYAHIVVQGGTLFETLMRNLVRYTPGEEESDSSVKDCPAWEREPIPSRQNRSPEGLLDLLTWRSRAIELVPVIEDNRVVVRRIALLGGEQISDDSDLSTSPEQMLSFRPNPAAQKDPSEPAQLPIRLDPDRIVWRDSMSFIGQTAESGSRLPGAIAWLGGLVRRYGYPLPDNIIPLDVIGQIADQAKLITWRHERLPLPLALLIDPDRAEILRNAIALSERIGNCLRDKSLNSPVGLLAHAANVNRFLTANEDSKGAKKERTKLSQTYFAPSTYWSRLDTAFQRLLVALAVEEPDEVLILEEWKLAALSSARASFQNSIEPLRSASDLLVVAEAENRFERSLARAVAQNSGYNSSGAGESSPQSDIVELSNTSSSEGES